MKIPRKLIQEEANQLGHQDYTREWLIAKVLAGQGMLMEKLDKIIELLSAKAGPLDLT